MTDTFEDSVPRCFIVRIYRQGRNRAECPVGLVEEVGKEGTRAFKNVEELWTILKPHRKSREAKS